MIKHLSASQLCLFRSSPALWVGRYLLNWQDEAGPAAWRGSAVEAGLDLVLYNRSAGKGTVTKQALRQFEHEAQGDAAEDVEKQRQLIAPLVDNAGLACLALPVPTARQFRVEYWLDDMEWPVVGYVDYLWPDFLVDLKTTERMPSEPKADHLLQVSLYAAATERQARLLYVTPKKYQWFEISPEQQEAGLQEARRIARNIKSLLALSDNPHRLLSALPMDFDNFRWSTPLKQLAMQAMEMN